MKITVPFKYVAKAKLDSGKSIKVVIRDSYTVDITEIGNVDSSVNPFVTFKQYPNSQLGSREFFKGDGSLYESVQIGVSKTTLDAFKNSVETNALISPFNFLTVLSSDEKTMPIFNAPTQAKAVYKNLKNVDRRTQVDTIKAIANRYLVRGTDILKEIACIDLIFDAELGKPNVKIETSEIAGKASVLRQPIDSYLEAKETIVKTYKENLIDMPDIVNFFAELKERIKFYSSTDDNVIEASVFDLIASYQTGY